MLFDHSDQWTSEFSRFHQTWGSNQTQKSWGIHTKHWAYIAAKWAWSTRIVALSEPPSICSTDDPSVHLTADSCTRALLSTFNILQWFWQLVGGLEHVFFHIVDYSGEFHHPNWRSHIFQRGRYTTNQAVFFLTSNHVQDTDCRGLRALLALLDLRLRPCLARGRGVALLLCAEDQCISTVSTPV